VLNSLADRFHRSALQRHLFFLAAALFTIALVGYHFGTFDQAIHIPFLKKYADPSLFPGDAFFEMRHQHYSFFWFLFLPFYRLGVLEPVLFAVHVFITYFTFWALWTLSDTLFQNPLASLLGALALAIPHLGFAGFPLFEFSLLNRTFVLPFLLWAIILFLRRRYWLAFALLGAMYNLHVISVNFALAMLLFAALRDIRAVGWRNLLVGTGLFVLAALPVLVWRFTSPPVTLRPDPEWFSIISRGMIANLFYLIAPYFHILFITLCGLSTLALFFIARRSGPPRRHDRAVTNFIVAVLIILAVQTVTAQWYPVTIIVQAQIIRAGLFVLVFGYLYFANYLAELYRCGATSRPDFRVLAEATIVSPVPAVPVAIWGLQRLIRAPRWRSTVGAAALVGTFSGSVALAIGLNVWAPGIYIYARRTPWYETQIWARDNTPKDAVFITPPHLWWFYDPEWRVYSERSNVVMWSDLLEIALVPDYVGEWQQRFETLAPGALARFRGNVFESRAITARAFYSLSADDLTRAAREYGASYLVVEKPHTYGFPVAYENAQFVIYQLPLGP
jgi:hypothetical protein